MNKLFILLSCVFIFSCGTEETDEQFYGIKQESVCWTEDYQPEMFSFHSVEQPFDEDLLALCRKMAEQEGKEFFE